MTKTVLIITIILLGILGLAEILHNIKLYFVYSKRRSPSFSIICLDKERAEQQLLFAASQRQWLGRKYADYVIAVNSFLGEDSVKYEAIAKKHGIIYCSFEELNSVLMYLSGGKM